MMNRYLVISSSVDLVRVAPGDLVFVSSDGNYCTLVFTYGESRVVTLQLGQIEQLIERQLPPDDNSFIRIGKSLIINRNYISYVNPGKQQLSLADGRSASHTLTASREALRQLKELIEKEGL